ncbi:MAG: hypothetical protein J1G06_01910 [Oscillospiraceae bacterium]|nr:hypothetical protein [Oscillospiraceae bacterium]
MAEEGAKILNSAEVTTTDIVPTQNLPTETASTSSVMTNTATTQTPTVAPETKITGDNIAMQSTVAAKSGVVSQAAKDIRNNINSTTPSFVKNNIPLGTAGESAVEARNAMTTLANGKFNDTGTVVVPTDKNTAVQVADIVKNTAASQMAEVKNNSLETIQNNTGTQNTVDYDKATGIQRSEGFKRYSGDNKNIARIDSELISQGVSDTNRAAIINSLEKIEGTKNSTSRVTTSDTVTAAQQTTDNINKALHVATGGKLTNEERFKLVGTNLNMVANDTVSAEDVSSYAEVYTAVLAQSNPAEYNILSEGGNNPAKVITDYLMTGTIPAEISSPDVVEINSGLVAGMISGSVTEAAAVSGSLHGGSSMLFVQAESLRNKDYSFIYSTVRANNAAIVNQVNNNITPADAQSAPLMATGSDGRMVLANNAQTGDVPSTVGAGTIQTDVRNVLADMSETEQIQFDEVRAEDKIPGLLVDEYTDALSNEEKTTLDIIGKKLGVPIKIVENIAVNPETGERIPDTTTANGVYYNGVIYISLDASDKPMVVMSHEITHHMATQAREEFRLYSNYVLQALANKNNTDVQSLIDEKIASYERRGMQLDYNDAVEEIAADYTREFLNDTDSAREFIDSIDNTQARRSILRRFVDAIRNILNKLRSSFKRVPQAVRDLHNAQAAFNDMAKATVEQQQSIIGKENNGNSRYSFAGENAATADTKALSRAQQMERNGETPETIWRETGWGSGLDGQSRFEIDDSGAEFSRAGLTENPDILRFRELQNKFIDGTITGTEMQELQALNNVTKDVVKPSKVGDYLKHDKLFEAYPYLKDIPLSFEKMGNGTHGSYNPNTGEVVLNSMDTPNKNKETLLHELQHVIQSNEGFSGGASPEYYKRGNITEAQARKLYRNTAGEIEARDTGSRINMTLDERRNTFPESMRQNGDVVFADSDVSYSKSPSGSETKSIREQIRNSLDELNELDSVASETVDPQLSKEDTRRLALYKFGRLSENVGVDSKSYAIHRENFGDIRIGKKQISKALAYLGSPSERAALLTVPEVLKYGVEITERANHKGRQYDTYTFAAPVEINGERGIQGVVVKRTDGNRYKTHRILMPDGSIFKFSDNKKQRFTNGMTSVSGGDSPSNASVLNNRVPNQIKTSDMGFNYSVNNSISQWGEGVKSEIRNNDSAKSSFSVDMNPKLQSTGRVSASSLASDIINTYGVRNRITKATVSEGIENVRKRLYDTYYGKGDINEAYAELESIARETAEQVADKMRTVDETSKETYDMLRKEIKGTKISVSEQTKSDIPDWNDWKKANFGKLTISNDGIPVDSYYRELMEQYPQFFDETLEMTQADQLEKIVDVLDNIKPREIELTADEKQAVIDEIASDIIDKAMQLEDDMLSGSTPVRNDPTTYQSGEVQLKMQNVRQTEREKARARERVAIEKAREKAKEHERDSLQKLKDNLREKAREQKERARKQRSESDERKRLLKIAKRIQSMKMSEAERAMIPDIIAEIDTKSLGLREKGYTRSDGTVVQGRLDLQKLKDKILEAQKNDPNYIPNKELELKIARLDKKHIKDMDISDVRELIKTVLQVESEIKDSRKLLNDAKKREIIDVAKKSIDEIRRAPGAYHAMDKPLGKYVTTQLSPIRFARRISGYAKDSVIEGLFNDINEGAHKSLMFQMHASRKFDKLIENKKALKKFTGKDAELINISKYDPENRKVVITPAMRVSLYLHSKNYDNLRHIQHGGIVIPDIDLLNKGKYSRAYNVGDAVDEDGKIIKETQKGKGGKEHKRNSTIIKLTPSQVKEITSGMTDFERLFADRAYSFFNADSKKAVNEASLVLKGYELATVEDYFPINTDRRFLKKPEDGSNTDATSLETMGMLHERIQNGAPIYLEDVITVLDRHMKNVGDYNGLAIPLRNFNKVYNFTAREYGTSFTNELTRKWGDGAETYISRLMDDLNGRSPQGGSGIGFLGRYAQATLTGNVSVMLKQAASYPTAASVIGWGPLVKAFGEGVSDTDMETIKEYTPLLWYRSKGFRASELGDYVDCASADWIEKVKIPWVTDGIQRIDIGTTTKLWKASEFYVRKHNPKLEKGTDAYNKKVAETYTKVIEETQPNYTTMQRPHIMRRASSNAAIKAFTMFATQPLQNFNLVYDSFGEYRARAEDYRRSKTEENKQALKDARHKFLRTCVSILVSSTILNLCNMLWTIIKGKFKEAYGNKNDDGEYEVTWGSFGAQFAQDEILALVGNTWLGGTITPFVMQAFSEMGLARDAVSYDMVNPELDMFNGLKDKVLGVVAAFSKDDKNPWTIAKSVDKAAESLAKIYGIPVKNYKNFAMGLYRNFTDIARKDNIFELLDDWSENFVVTTTLNPGSKKAQKYKGKLTFKQYLEYKKYYDEQTEKRVSGEIKTKQNKKYANEDSAKAAAKGAAVEHFKPWFTKVNK